MRIFISRAVAALLALALLAGVIAGQGKKKKRTKASKADAAKTKPATATAPTPPAQPYTGDPIPPPQAPEQGDGVRRITPAEAHEALEKGTAIIIDVRNEDAFKMGHVKGARLIPSFEIGAHIKELPRDKMIITYCS